MQRELTILNRLEIKNLNQTLKIKNHYIIFGFYGWFNITAQILQLYKKC